MAHRPFSVLRFRDYRLLLMGQVLSMTGTQMQRAALLWHLYHLTQSPFAMGGMGLARVAPLVLFALFGGVVADALDRRRMMLACQTLMGLLAAGLGIWSYLGLNSLWPLYAVAALNAGIVAFDGPARQSLLPSLVPRDHLTHAVSLNSLVSQLAGIVGPALIGLVILKLGVGAVYLLNAGSFLAVISALLAMRLAPGTEEPPAAVKINLTAALEGLRYVTGHRLLLSLMLLDFLATFFAGATTLLPMYADRILHVGPAGYGWLAAASGVGALLTAAVMAVFGRVERQGWTVLWAVMAYGAFTVALGATRHFWVAFLMLAGTGAADMVSTVIRQTIRQLVTPDALRGRMTSINMLFFQGGPQLGEVEAGVVAGWLGVPFSIISGGVACILATAIMMARAPWLRSCRGEER